MVRRLIVPILLVAASSMQACGFCLSTTVPRVRLDLQFEKTLPSTDLSPVETEEAVRGLPPVLQQIADERREFQMNLGKAMDTLRKDMPYILKRSPDFNIYHDDIVVIDPSGVQLTGLDSYKSSVRFLQTFCKFWFQERSGLQYRMVYDFARSSIRISWHAVLVPKVPLGRPMHIDGISMYKLDSVSGKIVEHKIENLMINDSKVIPPYGIVSLMQQELVGFGGQPGLGVPAGI
mmetsp:Transcript_6065/g.16973  ORF Transcript_6065/g.16973 Transcript_6065/m.16973 type:complete len:234 (+) Transcript_6065:50-751(+)